MKKKNKLMKLKKRMLRQRHLLKKAIKFLSHPKLKVRNKKNKM